VAIVADGTSDEGTFAQCIVLKFDDGSATEGAIYTETSSRSSTNAVQFRCDLAARQGAYSSLLKPSGRFHAQQAGPGCARGIDITQSDSLLFSSVENGLYAYVEAMDRSLVDTSEMLCLEDEYLGLQAKHAPLGWHAV